MYIHTVCKTLCSIYIYLYIYLAVDGEIYKYIICNIMQNLIVYHYHDNYLFYILSSSKIIRIKYIPKRLFLQVLEIAQF